MPALFDRSSSSAGSSRARVPSKQWDAGLQQFVRNQPTVQPADGATATVPRMGARAMERMPDPGQYNVRPGPDSTGMAGVAAFKASADRSLVNKSQAAVPGIGAYDPNYTVETSVSKAQSSGMASRSERFQANEQQKLTASLPSGYSGTSSFEYGSIASSVNKASMSRSSMFASSTIRSSYVPLPKGEGERILRKAQEDEELAIAWEAELQAQREADPEWQAEEAARIEAERAEAERIETAARDAAERVAFKEREEAKAKWIAARAAEEWAWKQAEEEAEAVEAAQGTANTRLRSKQAEERRKKRDSQKLGALWAWNEAEEEEDDEEEGGGDNDEETSADRLRAMRSDDEREARIATRAAQLVRQREEQMRAEAAERAEAAAAVAGERAAERVRAVQEAERQAAQEAWEARMTAEAARDLDAEATRIAEAAMTAAQRAKSREEREARMAARAAERAVWEAAQSRLLAEEERLVRRAYEEARAAEKQRLDAEEKVRREEERARQELAVQDWSWQEAMELAWDRHEKAIAVEVLRIERSQAGIGAVKSRQKLAEEKSLARSQISRMNGSVAGGGTSAAFSSTSSRFDKSTVEAMKYVNPELRAKQRTHEKMLERSRRRAERLCASASVLQRYAKRWLATRQLARLKWHKELDVAAPPLQALVRGWKVRARLRWCANISTRLQRYARGFLARRLARFRRERVPTIQAASRGLAARVYYRHMRSSASTIAAGARGMRARGAARAIRNDPKKVYAYEQLVRVRTFADELNTRLAEHAASRQSESVQLRLALQHEHDKLGAAYRDSPAVAVMLQQERLAQQDSEDISVGRSRSTSLITLLAQVPFNRAADALQAVESEVGWLHELVQTQQKRDELYRPASHRPRELMTNPLGPSLSTSEQLDSYRSVSRTPTKGGSRRMSDGGESPPELSEADKAAERARRQAASRVASGTAAAAKPAIGWKEPAQAAKKWMGKGPPPPGWGKVRNLPPPPPGFKPGSASAAAAAAAALQQQKQQKNSSQPRPASAPKERRNASPRPGVSPRQPSGPSPRSANASPAAKRAPSPVPSLKTGGGGFGFAASPSASVRSTGSARPMSAASSGRSQGSMRSQASMRSDITTSSTASSVAPTGAGLSNRSNASSTASADRLRKAVAKRPPTQLDFETQRLQRMAKAQMAKEQDTLEKAKRQAQRSKRVAGFIIDPKRLEEEREMRSQEALGRMRDEKARDADAKASAEEAKKREKEAHQEKAAKAGQIAMERLKQRKAEERRKREEAEREVEREEQDRVEAEEMARQARNMQRQLRAQTSFFARPADGAKA